jgi:hypothetical protein
MGGGSAVPADAGAAVTTPRAPSDAGVPVDAGAPVDAAPRVRRRRAPDAAPMSEEEATARYLKLLEEVTDEARAGDFRAMLQKALEAMKIYPDDPQSYGPATVASCRLHRPRQAKKYFKGVTDTGLRVAIRETCTAEGIELPE